MEYSTKVIETRFNGHTLPTKNKIKYSLSSWIRKIESAINYGFLTIHDE